MQASCSGEAVYSGGLTLAPWESKSFTHSMLPEAQASQSGVLPSMFRASTSWAGRDRCHGAGGNALSHPDARKTLPRLSKFLGFPACAEEPRGQGALDRKGPGLGPPTSPLRTRIVLSGVLFLPGSPLASTPAAPNPHSAGAGSSRLQRGRQGIKTGSAASLGWACLELLNVPPPAGKSEWGGSSPGRQIPGRICPDRVPFLSKRPRGPALGRSTQFAVVTCPAPRTPTLEPAFPRYHPARRCPVSPPSPLSNVQQFGPPESNGG